MKRIVNREGYWWSKYEPKLPKPISNLKPWKGKTEFLKRLRVIEKSTTKNHYKGFSRCRICNKVNGTKEHVIENWNWPEGFLHYVEEHNVRPSIAFQEFILQGKIFEKD